MSSGPLDKSLDEILKTQRRPGGGRRSTRNVPGKRVTAAAPTGGIQKKAKPARNAIKPMIAKGHGITGESKIMLSNMPKDVSETQIKDFLNNSVGSVKRVEISYGPGGVSRGIAHVSFHTSDGASKAYQQVNGILIDNKPVKVEVIVSSADQIPQPKPILMRMTQAPPKTQSQPKAKVGKQPKAVNSAKSAVGNKPKRGRNTRPTKKTEAELDSEMADYFDSAPVTENANGDGAVAVATNGGDAQMEDEIL